MPKQRMAEIGYLWAEWYLIYTPFAPFKVNYPMNDESTLCDAGCFFGLVANKVAKREQI